MNGTFEDKISLHFPTEFYKEEVRCEYRITEKAKRVMAVELDLLHQMDKVCKQYGIQYFIYCGTLLGAVRHQGFIPWDDDVDVAMTRENFNKFVEVAPKAFKHPYFLQTALTDRQYFFGYARLRNSLTTGLILENDSPSYNNGIYIDIFVLDGFIESDRLLEKQIREREVLLYLLSAYPNNGFKSSSIIKKILKQFLHFTFCKIISYETVYKWFVKRISLYNGMTNKLTLMTHSVSLLKNYWCTKEEIKDIVYLSFENIQVPAPAKYIEILTHTYGNYMKFPPVEKRGAWHEGILELDPDTPYQDYLAKRNTKR